jgi:hypothetical protein
VGKYGKGSLIQDGISYCADCPVGTYMDALGRHNAANPGSHACRACPSGQFMPTEGASACFTCTTTACPADMYESKACSATADRVCSPIPAIGGIAGCHNFVENGGADAMVPAASVTFGATLSSASLTMILEGNVPDTIGYAGTNPNIAHSSRSNSMEIVVSLTGTASVSEYDVALRALTFNSPGEMAGHVARNVRLVLKVCHTPSVCSKPVAMCVNVKPVNDGPVITVPAAAPTFTQGGVAVPVAPAAVVTDLDDTHLLSATVAVAPFKTGDVLAAAITGTPISGAFSAGALKLTGSATLAQYQAVLRTVTFKNTVTHPNVVNRAVSITLVDGTAKQSETSAIVSLSMCATRGNFANGQTNAATACPHGKYQADTCQAACTPCVAGTFGDIKKSVDVASHCAACHIGSWQSQEAQLSCVQCAAGRHGVLALPKTAELHCTDCAAGTSQSAAGASSCVGCAAGKFSDEGQKTCTPWTTCCAGKYKFGNAADTDGSCFICNAGAYKNVCDLIACTKCALGKYGDVTIARDETKHCVACPAGKFQDAVGMSNQAAPTADACKQCAPGTFGASVAQESCDACAVGQFQAAAGAVVCDRCVAGRFGDTGVPSTSSAHCVECAHGHFATSTGHTDCEPCPIGTHANPNVATSLAAHCSPCAKGTYQDEVVFGYKCKACPAGHFQPLVTQATDCTRCSGACSQGEYVAIACSAVADRLCRAIPAVGGVSGVVSFVENGQPVLAASSATVTFDSSPASSTIAFATVSAIGGNSATDVLSAPTTAGIVSSFGDQVLTLSGAGSAAQYEAALQSVRFAVTGDMHMQRTSRAVEVSYKVCHSATVCSVPKSVRVNVVPINDRPVITVSGSFTFTHGGAAVSVASNAHIVDVDHSKIKSASIALSMARAGDVLGFVAAQGSGIRGTYDAAAGKLQLYGVATKGDYQTTLRSVVFSSTAIEPSTAQRTLAFAIYDGDKKSLSSPQVDVSICAGKGTFADVNSATVRYCPAGKFQSDTCKASCDSCGQGTFGSVGIPVTSREHCVACKVGQFQTAHAQTECVRCSVGTFGKAGTSQSNEDDHCIACNAGTEQPTEGASACVACAAGKFSAAEGTPACDACPCGHYQDKTGATSCTQCAVGTSNGFRGQASAAACTACALGSYSPLPGQCMCKGWACCAAGSFNQGASAATPGFCRTCPVGKFRPTESCSAEKCISWGAPCGAGKFMSGATTVKTGTCESCNPGTYRTAAAAAWTACTKCAAGKFGNVPGQPDEGSACDTCKRGRYAPEAGTTKCEDCKAGEYGDSGIAQNHHSHCKTCTNGEWTGFSQCSKSCSGGVTTRTRELIMPAAASQDADEQCVLSQSKQCNTKPCPGRHHCHYLKCRFQLHAASNTYSVQVYHHHKEPHNVHHCKLYDNAFGTKACHCFCWYLNSAGQVNSAPEAATIAAKAKAQTQNRLSDYVQGHEQQQIVGPDYGHVVASNV